MQANIAITDGYDLADDPFSDVRCSPPPAVPDLPL